MGEIPSSSATSIAPTTPAAAKTAALVQDHNLWDDLVVDSRSVSAACPYAWCSDISLNNEDKVHLQDIQQRRIPSHGSNCGVKFDVADVAYPVVSLKKRKSCFTEIFRKVESLCCE